MIKSFIGAFLVTLSLVPLRYGGFGLGIHYSTLVGYPAFLALSFYCFHSFNEKSGTARILIGLLLGELVPFLNVIYGFFYGQTWFLPQLVIQTIAILNGFILWRFRSKIRFVPSIVGLLFAVFMFTSGFSYWLHFRNYGSFTGRVAPQLNSVEIKGRVKSGGELVRPDLENKFVLIDFWHTRCGSCFVQFPKLQEFHDDPNNQRILVYAINKPLDEDSENEAFDLIRSKGYTFPVLVPEDENLPEKFDVYVYPTTIILNKNGEKIFHGSLAKAISEAKILLDKDH